MPTSGPKERRRLEVRKQRGWGGGGRRMQSPYPVRASERLRWTAEQHRLLAHDDDLCYRYICVEYL